MAKTADLFPLGTAASIEAKPTRAEKVAYFLEHIVEPGADDYLPKLLTIMKDSKIDNVVKLAGKIEATQVLGKYICITNWQYPHNIIFCILMSFSYVCRIIYILQRSIWQTLVIFIT